MQPNSTPAQMLAARLRALREECWPEVIVTQRQLADAFSARKRVSVPAISSWESLTKPTVPTVDRLTAYAQFFATSRSMEGEPHLLDDKELTDVERSARDRLYEELIALRGAATDGAGAQTAPDEPSPPNPWQFDGGDPVTIVCAPLPPDLQERMPYTDPSDPDYIELYRYADLDALVELHGHIRAMNPESLVHIRLASDLEPDDYTTHLVLLGGVDWNSATRDMLRRLEQPVEQVPRKEEQDVGAFEVQRGDERISFRPVLNGGALVEDVAHFFRGPNPFNREHTVTICNGMFGRGVLGAVRTLTDERFRDRNTKYIHSRFADSDSYSILARVPVVNTNVLTPDWSLSGNRLHEWSESNG